MMGKERHEVPTGWIAAGELLFCFPGLVLWQELCIMQVRVLFQGEKFWGVMGRTVAQAESMGVKQQWVRTAALLVLVPL